MNGFSVIGAPLEAGAPTRGMEDAYEYLTGIGMKDVFPSGTEFGSLNRPFPCPEGDSKMKYRDEVVPFCEELAARVGKAVSSGRIAFTVGGDHAVAMGSAAGAARVCGHENVSVIYIDGHTDINTENSTVTGYIHGMPLASLMGLCGEKLTLSGAPFLLGKNTFIIGARSIDEGERPILKSQGVRVYAPEDIITVGTERVARDVISSVKTKYVHISFDVDFLDGGVFPATGYRMPGGMGIEDAKTLLAAFSSELNVVSADFAEYNPHLDRDGKCGKESLEIIKTFVEGSTKKIS